MSEKHTPGPWKSTKDGRIYSETATEWNRTANAETAAWVAATGENPANARLIASAPDLLAACEAWAERGWCIQGPSPKLPCSCDWHMAKAAIAKAKA